MRVQEKLEIPICEEGSSLDFSLAGFGIQLAAEDVQLLPVEIKGRTEPFFMLVCTRVVKCIDDERSGAVRHWKPEDGKPELVGQ